MTPDEEREKGVSEARQFPSFRPLLADAGAAGDRAKAAARGTIASERIQHSQGVRRGERSTHLLPAFLFVLGLATGSGATYLLSDDGGSEVGLYLHSLRATGHALWSARAAHRSGTGDGDIGIGPEASRAVEAREPPARPAAAAPSRDRSDQNPEALVLAQAIERELAARRLDQPAGDNALESYNRLAAISPRNPSTLRIGETLSRAFWIAANAAAREKRWDEAVRDYEVLKTLPPVPSAAILAEQSQVSGDPDRRGADDAAAPSAGGERSSGAAPNLVAAAPPADALAAVAPSAGKPPVDKPAAKTRDATAALLLERGDDAIAQGDVISARRFYELAASRGLGRAATAAGRTYDPLFLQERGVRGALADPAAAKRWYQKAADDGDAEAARRLWQLLKAADNGSR